MSNPPSQSACVLHQEFLDEVTLDVSVNNCFDCTLLPAISFTSEVILQLIVGCGEVFEENLEVHLVVVAWVARPRARGIHPRRI